MSQKEEYEQIPLYYCKDCKSLNIKYIGDFNEDEYPEDIYGDEDIYCANCGSTNITTTTIEEYLKFIKY